MGRPIRVEFPGATYHVMSRGVNGLPTFHDDSDRELFLRILGGLVRCGKLITHAYCLMGNHFHLLCETPAGRLSRWMQQFLCKYTRRFNHRHSRTGHLWQARYKAILVQEGDYFLHCSRYIHLNPVRAGLVREAVDYPWSSCAAYFRSEPYHGWVSRERTLRCFPSPADYASFVQAGVRSKLLNPLESAFGRIAFGDAEFAKQIRRLVKDPRWPDDADGLRGLSVQPDHSEAAIRRAVEEAFGDFSSCQKRRILIYCLRRFTALTGREIAAATSCGPSAVSHAWRSISNKLQKDTILCGRLASLRVRP